VDGSVGCGLLCACAGGVAMQSPTLGAGERALPSYVPMSMEPSSMEPSSVEPSSVEPSSVMPSSAVPMLGADDGDAVAALTVLT